MTAAVWERLLAEVRAVHRRVPQLAEFSDFPDDLEPTAVQPHLIPAAELMARDAGLATSGFAALRDACVAAGPIAHWRETYRGTDIGEDFLARFGCYCLIGDGGAWASAKMAAFFVYMPAHLDYAWHHHPAEEIYLVLAGQAEFMRSGEGAARLGPGQVSFHRSMQPHAMRTGAHPVLAYVAWRNHFSTRPVLTAPHMLG